MLIMVNSLALALSAARYRLSVDFLFDYRKVWAAYPLLRIYAVIVVIGLALAVFGTIERGPLSILFVPALAGAYMHHLMVQKRL
jgi:hypothetical protein